MRILLADDDRALADTLRRGLEEKGHQALVSYNGIDAFSLAQSYEFDVLILDVTMPGLDGFTVARRLRDCRIHTPVILLTARDTMEEIVRGFDEGADDYITKPFSFQVLLARLRAIARRGPISKPPVLRVGDLSLNPSTREVTRGARRLDLTSTEYKLLETLMRKSGHAVHRELLLQAVWGYSNEVESNTLDAFIHLLRDKVDAAPPKLIHTVRNVGYCLRDSAA